mmetsp:Transcript_23699/g.62380  ORF Transcript_23699/g.62380 Transcript_23699/m.62380 type:complete len:237 (-) Transcript_23699:129-839(-)
MVHIFTTQRGVTVRRLHFEHASRDLQDGDVKSSASQIVHSDNLAILVVHSKRQCGGSRLIDNTQNLETRNLACILSCLTLCVIEVRGDCDHCLLNSASQMSLGGLLHLPQNESSNLTGGVLLASRSQPRVTVRRLQNFVRQIFHILLCRVVIEPSTNQPLCSEDRVLWIRDSLSLRGDADQTLPILRERHHRRCGAHALTVFDHSRCGSLHNGDARIGCAKIDPDYVTLRFVEAKL